MYINTKTLLTFPTRVVVGSKGDGGGEGCGTEHCCFVPVSASVWWDMVPIIFLFE